MRFNSSEVMPSPDMAVFAQSPQVPSPCSPLPNGHPVKVEPVQKVKPQKPTCSAIKEELSMKGELKREKIY